MNVDLPALGNPMSAASAMRRSSSRNQRCSPYSPCSAKVGARRALVRKRRLPRPPRPPRAASQRSPWVTRSASTWSVSWSRTVVPSGTITTRSCPLAPCRCLPCPCVPDSAFRCGWSRNARSDATLRSACSHTSPPEPPSPPSGPPFGVCDSLRNDMQPAPPSPPRTLSCASSTKLEGIGRATPRRGAGDLGGNDVDELAATTAAELHDAVARGEQRVVAATTDVLTRVELGPTLAHDDRARGDLGAAVDLDAESLGRGVATVAGGGGALLLRHGSALRDRGDLDRRVVLAVTPPLAVVRLRLVGEAVDLRPLRRADDLGLHRGAAQLTGGREHGVAVDQQDRAELDLAVVDAEPLDVELLAGLDLVLLAAGGDHCVHGAEKPRGRSNGVARASRRGPENQGSLQHGLVDHEATPPAHGAGLGEGLHQTLGDALAGHLHKPELREIEDLGAGLVPGESIP